MSCCQHHAPQYQPPPEMVAAWILQAQRMILTLSNVLCSSHHSCSDIRISLCSWAAFIAIFCFIDFSKPLREKGKASERAISYREVILAEWAPGVQVGEEKHCLLSRGWSCNAPSSRLSVIFIKTIVKPFHHFVPGEKCQSCDEISATLPGCLGKTSCLDTMLFCY